MLYLLSIKLIWKEHAFQQLTSNLSHYDKTIMQIVQIYFSFTHVQFQHPFEYCFRKIFNFLLFLIKYIIFHKFSPFPEYITIRRYEKKNNLWTRVEVKVFSQQFMSRIISSLENVGSLGWLSPDQSHRVSTLLQVRANCCEGDSKTIGNTPLTLSTAALSRHGDRFTIFERSWGDLFKKKKKHSITRIFSIHYSPLLLLFQIQLSTIDKGTNVPRTID